MYVLCRYNVGWSYGKEKLGDKPDFGKGSYYGNPLVSGWIWLRIWCHARGLTLHSAESPSPPLSLSPPPPTPYS